MFPLSAYLQTFPTFAAYFAISLGLLVQFVVLYTVLTPYREFRLIKEGNAAPAITLGGAVLGFVLPLAAVIKASVGLVDVLLWGGVATIVQLLAVFIFHLCFPSFKEAILNGKMSVALLLAQLTIAVGLLNAACMSW